MRVLLSWHARADIDEAMDYYLRLDPELGTLFLHDLDAVIDRIAMFSQGAPPVDGFEHLRRARMRRFPYGIFYRLPTDGGLMVVRVLHTRRDTPAALEG